jgi:hypothetical protein
MVAGGLVAAAEYSNPPLRRPAPRRPRPAPARPSPFNWRVGPGMGRGALRERVRARPGR